MIGVLTKFPEAHLFFTSVFTHIVEMFIFSSVSEDRDREFYMYFNNLTQQVLFYIKRWTGVPHCRQRELGINLALLFIDFVTLGKFFKIVMLILKKVVTIMPVSGVVLQMKGDDVCQVLTPVPDMDKG